jgi:hypothetical protein
MKIGQDEGLAEAGRNAFSADRFPFCACIRFVRVRERHADMFISE